jgi:signal transduction histidine kinase
MSAPRKDDSCQRPDGFSEVLASSRAANGVEAGADRGAVAAQGTRAPDRAESDSSELTSFAYIISHDLRAPLINIKGFSAQLNGDLEELTALFGVAAEHLDGTQRARATQLFEQEIPEALDFINSSVLRMDRLITAVLKLSRLGHRELQVEPVPLGELVQAILKSMSHQIEARGATVCMGELPELRCDRIALEQILGNLLDNAVKYLEPGRPGRLEIFSESGAGGTVIHVRDNGRGIPREDQLRIFDIFRRVGRQDVQGEGMGLSYVRTLIRRLHGQIWCHSEPGSGSTFTFSLPHGDLADYGSGI